MKTETPERTSDVARHTPAAPTGPKLGDRVTSRLPGLALALGIAAVATVIGTRLPLVGGPVSGIVIGTVLASVLKLGDGGRGSGLGSRIAGRLRPGIGTASRTLLQVSVVVLGAQLSLRQIVQVGAQSLPVMIGTLAVCLSAAYVVGRKLKVTGDLATLIGVGTGICGASAIAAVTPVIGAVGVDVAYAISTIFVFNIAAVLVFPLVGHLLGLSQHAFGLFSGTAVNDTSSVIAAATAYGNDAADYAVVVKLTRTLLIIPICLVLAALVRRRAERQAGGAEAAPATGAATTAARRVRVRALIPWFLVGFLVAAAINTAGLVPAELHPLIGKGSGFLITTALAAIGLSTDFTALRRTGPRPLVLGAVLWITVSVTSLGIQAALHG
ncbi:putative sulfate exporter family transporter [Actinospica sp. MGRD01-02]|uniref:Sulfate exporter family transporter n=1 Tax=Actinospica acidithermotolerans TaxID=2828514 RepID=A0A941IIN4_9ACTN|nr:putative sulfate exporter family transporter [Actinospica acidithermotolerans]MBR7828524.1 putative sulfate exporter family transporter [Actinospica acidithermotolerans]